MSANDPSDADAAAYSLMKLSSAGKDPTSSPEASDRSSYGHLKYRKSKQKRSMLASQKANQVETSSSSDENVLSSRKRTVERKGPSKGRVSAPRGGAKASTGSAMGSRRTPKPKPKKISPSVAKGASSKSSWRVDTAPDGKRYICLCRLLHTRHCSHVDCVMCVRDVASESAAARPSKKIRLVIDLFETCYKIAKATLVSAIKKKERSRTSGAKKMKGTWVDNFGYEKEMTEKRPCPRCLHPLLQMLFSRKYLSQCHAASQEAHGKEMAKFERQHKSKRNARNQPRLRLKKQEYKCPCDLLSGINCPICGGDDPNCEICECDCNIGPFGDKDFQAISAARQAGDLGIEEDQGHQTVNQKRRTFQQLLCTGLANGKRDCRREGLGDDPVAVVGSAARYIAESKLEVNTVHQIGTDMGAPTDTFEDGTNVRTFQAASRGFRHYRGGLSDFPEETGGTLGSGDEADDEAAPGRKSAGVEIKKAISFRSRCVQSALKGSENDATTMRRKKRLITQLMGPGDDCTMEKLIVKSYEESVTPRAGMSQEAVHKMIEIGKTPEGNSSD